MFFRSLILLALLLVSYPAVQSAGSEPIPRPESGRYGIDYWREAEGLAQSRIRAIIQTRDGYLWLGTDNGVVRFNGASFTSYTVETGSLKDNEVWSILEDDQGGLWIGTYGGGLTLLRDGKFKTFTEADGMPADIITQLDQDADGNIWIAVPDGVYRYADGVFNYFTAREGLESASIHGLCARSSYGVLVAGGKRLFRFQGDRFVAVAGVVTESDGVIEHMLAARDGSLWLSFGSPLVKRWKDGVVTTYTRAHGLTSHIETIFEDANGSIWAALDDGMKQLREGRFGPAPLEADVTGLGVIYCLFGDREGNIWLGLQANGLARLRVKEISTISASDGLFNDSTRAVFEDRNGTLWIGTAAGFSTFRDGRINNYPEAVGVRLSSVRSFAEDSEGSVWIGAGEDLLVMRNGIAARHPGWTARHEIKVMYRDPRGRIWIGTDGGGLFKFENGRFTNYQASDGLAGDHIRGILLDRAGALWISCSGNGLSKFVDGKFTNYSSRDGLAGDRVLDLYEDDEGTLWFSTRDGLSRFRDGKFFNYSAESGLFVGAIYTILDDGKGNFWFSCAQGLYRVSKSELREFAEGNRSKVTSVDFGVRDGMNTRAFNLGNQPAAWKAADGRLLFCSLKGLVIVHPDRIAPGNFLAPIYIEEVLFNREKHALKGESQVPIGGGEVEIHFAALSYSAPEKLRYKYKLEGYDKDWIDAGTRRFAYYANLSPGQYRFRVMAGSADGPWNEASTSYDFYLKPKFYQTRWFLALMIVTGLLLVWLLYRHHMSELKARYAAVLEERKRIALEIHDTLAQNLAGIALQLDSVSMQVTGMPDGQREVIDQAYHLTRYSLSEARRAITDLRSDELEQQDLSLLLPAIASRMTANSAVQLDLKMRGTPRKQNPVTEKNLLRIFQEALANAVQHANASTIEIELNYRTDDLLLRVADDGRGFDTRNIIPLGVGHYGLTGMRERAERIGGRLTLTSAPGNGTELTVQLPFTAPGALSSSMRLEH